MKHRKNIKRKNTIKAVAYIIVGVSVSIASTFAVFAMYFSSTFLPVYIAGKYVLRNQIIRYTIYAVLMVLDVCGALLMDYACNFLSRRRRKAKRR